MSNEGPQQPPSDVTRRSVLRGAAVTGVAVPFLAACGSGGGEAASPKAGTALASAADVPVGGGTVLQDQQIVLTQPVKGEFKAFTAVCTHQQCVVASVEDKTIMCDCHGSMYSAEDGSVEGGPAPSPLEEITIKVEGDQIVKA